LHRIGSVVFTRCTFDRVIEPVLSDLQIDYYEALNEGATYKARWVRCRGHANFWICISAQLPISLSQRVVALWKASRQ